MTLDESKTIHALITYFQAQHTKKTGRKAIVNRNKVKYLIHDMLQDLTADEIKALIRDYVARSREPNIMTMCYEYDTFLEELKKEKEDIADRQRLLKSTEQSVKEYRERFGR